MRKKSCLALVLAFFLVWTLCPQAVRAQEQSSLRVTGYSDHRMDLNEDGDYVVSNVRKGERIKLGVEAESTISGAEITYSWEKMIQGNPESYEQLQEKGKELTLEKREGNEVVFCNISDGSSFTTVLFHVNPERTLSSEIHINGVTPDPMERGYMYVAKTGEQVKISVDVVSSNDSVTYSWIKRDPFTGEAAPLEETGNTLTVIKKDTGRAPQQTEQYECNISDGNELLNVSVLLFCIDPYQLQTEVENAGGTPDMRIDNEREELANYLFRENLDALSEGSDANVRLSVENQEKLSEEEQALLEEQITSNVSCVANLDLKLYTSMDGQVENQVTETEVPMVLSMELPDHIDRTEDGAERTYEIIRIHDGKADILPTSYDKEAGTLTFQTDRFSTYVLAYKDAGGGSSSENINHPEKNVPAEAPKTGDSSALIWAAWIFLLAGAAVGLVPVLSKRKK